MKFNKEKALSTSVFIIRVTLGIIFILSSIPKIKQPYDFLASIYNFEIAGPKLGMLVAMSLPWAELLAGICLVGGVFVSGALLVCSAMGAMFVFVIVSALVQGLKISCGCFGSSSTDVIGYYTLIRAGTILIFAFAGYLMLIIKTPKAKI